MGLGARLAAAANLELAQDRRHVVADGLLGEDEALRDVGITKPLSQQLEDLELPRGESGGILPRFRAWPARHLGATLSQAAGDDRCRGSCSQLLQVSKRLAQSPVVIGVREGESRFIRTPELSPEFRCRGPLASHRGSIRLCGVSRDLFVDSGAPAPTGK